MFLIPLFIFYSMRDFKFFEDNEPQHWWNEPDVIEAMNVEDIEVNNVLYQRIEFLEDELERCRNNF